MRYTIAKLSRAEGFIGRWQGERYTSGAWKQRLEQAMSHFANDVDAGMFKKLSGQLFVSYSDFNVLDVGHFVATLDEVIAGHNFVTTEQDLLEIALVCEEYLLWLQGEMNKNAVS